MTHAEKEIGGGIKGQDFIFRGYRRRLYLGTLYLMFFPFTVFKTGKSSYCIKHK